MKLFICFLGAPQERHGGSETNSEDEERRRRATPAQ